MVNFLSLPSELRNNIYEQVLVFQEAFTCPGQEWPKLCQPGALTPGLLRASRVVHHETASMLYAQNRFDFTKCTSEDVISFLTQIGLNNASYIQHIYIDFSQILCDITFEDGLLAEIERRGTMLGTLTTSLHNAQATISKANGLDYDTFVAKALPLVDARFKALSPEIIVEMYKEDSPDNDIQREMKSCGWKIKEMASCLDLSYPFFRGGNDPGPEAFITAFFELPLNSKKYKCYIGSYTSTLLITYEVLLYGQITKRRRAEYQLFNTLPILNVSTARLTPIFGRQPNARPPRSSLEQREWNQKFPG